jgi:DNA-binding response OmpR family regulator
MNHALNVLIVDDDPTMAKTLVDILQFKGYAAQTAHSGPEALEQCARRVFDCVISDVKMPGMNGVDLCHRLKRSTPEVVVVLMTAYSEDELVRKGRMEGATDVLTKPIHIDELLAFLHTLDEPH